MKWRQDTMVLTTLYNHPGFGHATRVSAIVEAILDVHPNFEVFIVSTAPAHVFNCLSRGAAYRYAEIDPVISQPVAYSVDRKRSFEVLRDFLDSRDQKLQEEFQWLRESHIDCVISDAVFLAWYAGLFENASTPTESVVILYL
jgi:predicted glycosyltransferase